MIVVVLSVHHILSILSKLIGRSNSSRSRLSGHDRCSLTRKWGAWLGVETPTITSSWGGLRLQYSGVFRTGYFLSPSYRGAGLVIITCINIIYLGDLLDVSDSTSDPTFHAGYWRPPTSLFSFSSLLVIWTLKPLVILMPLLSTIKSSTLSPSTSGISVRLRELIWPMVPRPYVRPDSL